MPGQIVKARIPDRFVQVPNETAQDNTLSWQALGLLTYLLSLPEDWVIYKTNLYKTRKTNKRTSTEGAFNELVEKNFIAAVEKRDPNGRFDGYDYIVYPFDYIKHADQLSTVVDFPHAVKPHADNQHLTKKHSNKETLDTKDNVQFELKGTKKKVVLHIIHLCEQGIKAFSDKPDKQDVMKKYEDLRESWLTIRSDEDLREKSFLYFWEIYKRKESKEPSRKKWNHLTWTDIHLIFHHVPRFVRAHPDKQYRLLPKTYLNEKRWNDEEIVEIAKKQEVEILESTEEGDYFARFKNQP